jgi:hypothetical protein
MRTNQIEFIWSDAWLLQAIALATEKTPASLKDVIATGDAINHAIFTYTELQTGLAKLLTAGYIEHEHDRFSLSPTFMEEYVRLSKTRGIRGQQQAIEKYLLATPWQPGYDSNKLEQNWLYTSVTREDFDKAIQEYLGSFRTTQGRKKKNG